MPLDSDADFVENIAEKVILKPVGYPLSGIFEDYPEIENPEVFECYAREQWEEHLARKGEYLFDRRMYPDFAYKIIDVDPPESVIGPYTTIIVMEDNNNVETSELNTDINFDDVIGQDNARKKCKLVEKFLENPDKFGKWAPRNILFYGPSGTGKTMLAKGLANKTNVPIITIKATELIGEYVGEGAKQIHQVYDRAENMAPCIIFIDELDAVALDRRYQELRGDVAEIVNALLTEMDGIIERKGVCTIGATNRKDTLDSAVSNRFEEEIEFVLPDENERLKIIENNIKTFPLPIKNVDMYKIAKLTQGFSGRDIVEKVLKVSLHQTIIDDKEEVNGKYLEDTVYRLQKKNNSKTENRMYI